MVRTKPLAFLPNEGRSDMDLHCAQLRAVTRFPPHPEPYSQHCPQIRVSQSTSLLVCTGYLSCRTSDISTTVYIILSIGLSFCLRRGSALCYVGLAVTDASASDTSTTPSLRAASSYRQGLSRLGLVDTYIVACQGRFRDVEWH